MNTAFFSSQPYDKQFFRAHNEAYGFSLQFFDAALSAQTVGLAKDFDAVCVFVNDKVDAGVIKQLKEQGTKYIALRCAGFNNVDLEAAKDAGIHVCRVPAYSPEAVAEHAVALILTLNRKTHKAYNRVREQNFALQGLMGFDLHGKTVGVVGTGKIGQAFCRIMLGFGCGVLAFDILANRDMEAIGVEYVPLVDLFRQSDIVSLHTPLNEQTRHLISDATIQYLKEGMMLINTSRGALIDTRVVIDALKSGRIGHLGIDVYEQEEQLFFRDRSGDIIEDDTIQRLMSFPNVLVTAHQAFFTKEAMDQIAETTLYHLSKLAAGETKNLPACCCSWQLFFRNLCNSLFCLTSEAKNSLVSSYPDHCFRLQFRLNSVAVLVGSPAAHPLISCSKCRALNLRHPTRLPSKQLAGQIRENSTPHSCFLPRQFRCQLFHRLVLPVH